MDGSFSWIESLGQRLTPRLSLSQVRSELQSVGVVIRRTDYGEYRVNTRGGSESSAYYTDDLEDALGTGLMMVQS